MWRALALAVMMVAGGARAQLNPSLSEAERGIRAGGPAAEARRLRITDLAVEADIVGRTAAVTLSLTVQTDAEAPYEADLTLRLPAGAVVTGYALDVGGRMIPGQLIEAPRAREAYEREVRGRVDPGLAEVTGERFATRVYPIDRLHPRKITVSFAAPFDPATGLVLPLARDAAIDRFAARVGIAGYATPPIVRIAGDAVTLASEGGRLVGSVAATGRALREGLSVAGGTPADTGAVARHANGRRFFVAEGASPPAAAPARGSRLRVYWDRSRSHRDGAIDAEIDALVRLVDTLAPTGIDVVTFASDRPQVAAVADAAGLRALLGRVVYRGGSSLAGLDALKLPAAGRCVLVFDGRVTIDRAAAFRPDCAPSALTGARDADAARLARLVRPGGGAVVRVGSADAAAAAAALAEGGGAVRAVSDASGMAIDQHVLPAAAGRWLIVGEAPTDGALHLTLRDGSRRVLRLATEVSGDAPGALLAVNRIADLADDPADHQRMLATARAFGIAGPGLSLLVLESPDQYLRARLAPPAGFDEAWMADYAEQRAQQRRDEADAKGERLERVLAAWADRRAWWAKRYPTGARPAKRRGESGPPGEAPPPPPPPAPAPPPLVAVPSAPGIAAEPAESDAADVVVTAALRRPRPPAARSGIEIELAPPPTDRPYLAALGTATPARRAAVLAEQERAYGTTPAFYLDAAEWFRARGDAGIADLLLMSALDLATADDETRRIVAFRLERDGRHDRAVELAEALAVGDADSRPPAPPRPGAGARRPRARRRPCRACRPGTRVRAPDRGGAGAGGPRVRRAGGGGAGGGQRPRFRTGRGGRALDARSPPARRARSRRADRDRLDRRRRRHRPLGRRAERRTGLLRQQARRLRRHHHRRHDRRLRPGGICDPPRAAGQLPRAGSTASTPTGSTPTAPGTCWSGCSATSPATASGR